MKVLIKAGSNVNQAKTDNGVSPLWTASQNGHLDIVKVLLKTGGYANQAKTTNGISTLLLINGAVL